MWAHAFAALACIMAALELGHRRDFAEIRRRLRELEHGDFCHCAECDDDERGR